jgi:NAD(P)H dehydrogenase (quinone)
MTYAISGASGKLGRLAAEALLATVPADQVVLTTRTPEALDDFAAAGAAVRYADFDEPMSLPAAFAGVDRLLMISASNATGKRKDQHGGALRAATAAGVQHVSFTSMPKVDDERHPVGLAAEEYREGEELVRAEARSWAILRMAPYAELHVLERLPELFGTGRIVTNAGAGRMPFISRADCAAAGVAVLTQDRHDNVVYDISGPESLTWQQVAQLVSEISGQDIGFVSMGDEEYRATTVATGAPPLLVDALVGMGIAVRDGWFDVPTDTFHELTGRTPATLREVLTAHRADVAHLAGADSRR